MDGGCSGGVLPDAGGESGGLSGVWGDDEALVSL